MASAFEMKRFSGPTGTYGIPARRACLLCLMAGLILSGCVPGSLNRARSAFYSGDVSQASQALAEPEKINNRNRLLYYMEKGAILHYSGDYQGSSEVLRNAAALIREQDIIRAGQQTVSLVTSDWMTDYKGEYAERLLVHTFQMMNYLLLGRPESALVEAKQALEVYDAWPEACNGDYFTRALIAHCFEVLGEINGAYIEYKKLAELMDNPGPVARKLCNLGSRLGFYDEVEHFRQFLPEPVPRAKQPPAGETLIFLSRGRAPVKVPENIVVPPSIRFSFVTYEDRSGGFPGPDIRSLDGFRGKEQVTTDVASILEASLDQRLVQIIAKETVRVASKEVIANNISDSNVELLVRLFSFLTEVPDTRCWETLPAYLTLIRVPRWPGDDARPFYLEEGGDATTSSATAASPDSRSYYHYQSIRY